MSGYDSFCGIYCGACLCIIVRETGTREETAQKLNKTIEQLTCTDCKTALHQDCCFVTCCTTKGINNCSECSEMPCEEITKFANDGLKHHSTIVTNLFRIRDIGLEYWLTEQKEKYSCPYCNARTGWSYTKCAQCGREFINN